MTTPPESTITPYDPVVQPSPTFESNRSNSFDDDDLLDGDDPLSRVYADATEFELFSKSEYAFISVSCFGVVLIPSLFLLVTKLVISFAISRCTNGRLDCFLI